MFFGYPIIHRANSLDLTNYLYSMLYCGTSGGTATVNGLAITIPATSTIDVTIRSISNVTGDLYALGVPMNTITGSTYIGGSYG